VRVGAGKGRRVDAPVEPGEGAAQLGVVGVAGAGAAQALDQPRPRLLVAHGALKMGADDHTESLELNLADRQMRTRQGKRDALPQGRSRRAMVRA
jgi:hypothetical protein